MDSENILGKAKVGRLLFKLSIPAMFAMFMQAMYNVIDSIFVGNWSQEGLTALSLAFPVQLITIAIGVGSGIGAGSLISRLLGQKKEEEAIKAFNNVLIMGVLFGITLAIVGILFSKNILQIFTDNTVLINYGSQYIKIILIGTIVLFPSMAINNVLRAQGVSIIPMFNMIIGATTNIILDPLIIFGIGPFPELGVIGAAYATVFARFVGLCFLIISFYKLKVPLKPKLEKSAIKLEKNILCKIYQVGLPAMILQALTSISIAFLNKIIISYGEVGVAVLGIYFRLNSFVLMPVFGLSQGFMPIMGYAYGAKIGWRMKKVLKYALISSFLITVPSLIFYQLFPEFLISLFNSNEELVSIGANALKKLSLSLPLLGMTVIMLSSFQALGDGAKSLYFSLLRDIFLTIPIAFIYSKIFAFENFWYSYPSAILIMVIVIVPYFIKYFIKVLYNIENSGETVNVR